MGETKTKKMHEAALRILKAYEFTGEPFSVFLSSWAFDKVHEILDEILDRPKRKVKARIGWERQVRILLQRHHLETVAVYRKGDEERIAIPDEWPALSLADNEWRERVLQIVRLADLIVLFWGVTTPGLAEEVEICASGTNALKTIVVTPAVPRDIFLSGLHKTFPRIAPLSEIAPFIALHPEFTPLIDRMKALKKLDPTQRSDLIDPDKRIKRFPLPSVSGRFDVPMWIE